MKTTLQETLTDTPRIYVASLADYNAGNLHGRWIDATQGADAIRAEIAEMLAASPEPDAEEFAIHDYDNFFGLCLSEFEDIERLAEVALLIAEHGPLFAGLAEHLGGVENLEEARQFINEGYRGEFDDLGAYAAEIADDLFRDALEALPGFIRYHIDWDAVGRDLELGGDIFTVELDGKVHVFDSNL